MRLTNILCTRSDSTLLHGVDESSASPHCRGQGSRGRREEGRPLAWWAGLHMPNALEDPKVKWSRLEFLPCFTVSPMLVPSRSLLLYSQHIPSQNKMRLWPCMLHVTNPPTHSYMAKRQSNAPPSFYRPLTKCLLVTSLNRRRRRWQRMMQCDWIWAVWMWSWSWYRRNTLDNHHIFKNLYFKQRRQNNNKNENTMSNKNSMLPLRPY